MKDSQPTSMKAIDYATVMAHLTRDDMIHFAKTYVRFVGKDYDSLSSDEQQAWMNAVLVSQFRELHLSQDILEKAMGRRLTIRPSPMRIGFVKVCISPA